MKWNRIYFVFSFFFSFSLFQWNNNSQSQPMPFTERIFVYDILLIFSVLFFLCFGRFFVSFFFASGLWLYIYCWLSIWILFCGMPLTYGLDCVPRVCIYINHHRLTGEHCDNFIQWTIFILTSVRVISYRKYFNRHIELHSITVNAKNVASFVIVVCLFAAHTNDDSSNDVDDDDGDGGGSSVDDIEWRLWGEVRIKYVNCGWPN